MSNIENREEIEWLNVWYPHGNQERSRYLLIGDSVTRAIRSRLEILLPGSSIDLFAASFSVADDLFWAYLRGFLSCKDYEYSAVIIDYGFHHGFSLMCCENQEDYIIFNCKYQEIVKACKSVCDNVVLMTGTAFADERLEREIITRNSIVKIIARENECHIIDLYEHMKSKRNHFSYIDNVHFEERANSFMAYQVTKAMFQMIGGAQFHGLQERVNQQIRNKLQDAEQIIIYGMGNIGNLFYYFLKCYAIEIEIYAWAVTKKDTSAERLFDIPVYNIAEIENKDCVVVVASEAYKAEMLETAQQEGFEHIKLFDYREWLKQ